MTNTSFLVMLLSFFYKHHFVYDTIYLFLHLSFAIYIIYTSMFFIFIYAYVFYVLF